MLNFPEKVANFHNKHFVGFYNKSQKKENFVIMLQKATLFCT